MSPFPRLDALLEAYDAAAARRRQDPHRRRLARELRRAFAKQRRAVLAAFATHRGEVMREAVADVPLDWLIGALHLSGRWITDAIQASLGPALLAGARSVLGRVLGIFDLSNPRAVAFLRQAENRSSLINATTFAAIRDILTQGIAEGASYSELARRIRAKFAEFGVRSPLRHIRDRAELIAVTEIGDAYSAGTLLAAQRLAEMGLTVEKRWLTAGDDRVEAECEGNEAEGWIPLDSEFSSGDHRPLAHPGCRCALLTRIARN